MYVLRTNTDKFTIQEVYTYENIYKCIVYQYLYIQSQKLLRLSNFNVHFFKNQKFLVLRSIFSLLTQPDRLANLLL
jgi:hypothetical protein